jgi:hypothetical protein
MVSRSLSASSRYGRSAGPGRAGPVVGPGHQPQGGQEKDSRGTGEEETRREGVAVWTAAVAAPAAAAGFYALAVLRGRRSLHPTGVGYQGELLVDNDGRPGIPLFRPGAGPPGVSPTAVAPWPSCVPPPLMGWASSFGSPYLRALSAAGHPDRRPAAPRRTDRGAAVQPLDHGTGNPPVRLAEPVTRRRLPGKSTRPARLSIAPVRGLNGGRCTPGAEPAPASRTSLLAITRGCVLYYA